MKYVCDECGWVYDPAKNDGVKFKDLPDDFKCPKCGAAKSEFSPMKSTNESKLVDKYLIQEKVSMIKYDQLKKWAKKKGFGFGVRKNEISPDDLEKKILNPSITSIQLTGKDGKILGKLQRNDKSPKSQWIYTGK